MTNGKSFRRTLAATAVLMALSLQAASANDVAYFKDVLKPGGHARTMAVKLADGRTCGVSGDTITVLMPVFQKCMSGRGWALDHYGPDPSQARPRATTVNFTDVKGDAKQQPRGAAALQSDTRACNAGAKDPESAAFKTCMAGRGWQFAFTQRAPAPAAVPSNTSRPNIWAWSNSGPASSPSSTVDDLAQINADIAQGSQDSADAMNAGIQATTQADAASDAQWQLDSIQASAPIPPQ